MRQADGGENRVPSSFLSMYFARNLLISPVRMHVLHALPTDWYRMGSLVVGQGFPHAGDRSVHFSIYQLAIFC
jgi:hypothetical protein